MLSDLRLRRRLLGAAIAGFLAVFSASVVLDRPGLGVAHGFYIPIGLIAVASGLTGGVAGGLVATTLYAVAVVVNPHIPPSDVPTVATAIRMVSFVAVGAMVGYFADANRKLMGETLGLVEELKILARRDVITGLPNTRGFEDAINRRLGEGTPFLLLTGEVVGTEALVADETRQVQEIALQLTTAIGRAHEVARVGPSQFAILAPLAPHRPAREAAAHLERNLSASGATMTFGWAAYPQDGKDALALFRAADERLYARKIVRGEWTPSAASAGLVEELPPRHQAV